MPCEVPANSPTGQSDSPPPQKCPVGHGHFSPHPSPQQSLHSSRQPTVLDLDVWQTFRITEPGTDQHNHPPTECANTFSLRCEHGRALDKVRATGCRVELFVRPSHSNLKKLRTSTFSRRQARTRLSGICCFTASTTDDSLLQSMNHRNTQKCLQEPSPERPDRMTPNYRPFKESLSHNNHRPARAPLSAVGADVLNNASRTKSMRYLPSCPEPQQHTKSLLETCERLKNPALLNQHIPNILEPNTPRGTKPGAFASLPQQMVDREGLQRRLQQPSIERRRSQRLEARSHCVPHRPSKS
ncbi:hypothetical protein F25303_13429 [Fusarium sp. NRRL 25303]|nr:hypothetical protein F25303_13429 [Fusarium sp. NRRL 25303]